MSLCVICGYSTLTADDVCAHHTASFADDWAAGNRLMCDFLHRGIVGHGGRHIDEVAVMMDFECEPTAAAACGN